MLKLSNLDICKKYIVACSGGPDSMALVDIMFENKFDFVVAHVNYRKRQESNRDQEIITDFCNERKIPIFILDADQKCYQKYEQFKNFQNKARHMRYDFFQKISQELKIDNLCLGHHRDDFLETAIWQDEIRNSKVSFYGIREKLINFNLHIYRPLLNIYKNDIIKYLEKNAISYGIDDSNYLPIYDRNKIRQSLEKLSSLEKDQLVEKYLIKNQKLTILENQIKEIYEEWKKTNFNIDTFNKYNWENRQKLIFLYLTNNDFDIKINRLKLKAICNFLNKKDHTKLFRIGNQIYLTKKNVSLAFIKKK